MAELQLERLSPVHGDDLMSGLLRHRDLAVLPLDGMGIEEQLLGAHIVEHGHGLGAHDHQLLLLERMEPAHENMALDAVPELQRGHGRVIDLRAEICAAKTGHPKGLFTQEHQQHRDVVGGEAPEDVLLGPELADVEAVGVDVLDLAQDAGPDELLELQHRGMVLEEVAHHQDAPLAPGGLNQVLSLANGQGEGLFHIDVLAFEQRTFDHLVMGLRRGRDGDGLDGRVSQHCIR
jgi:hypothetical protein